MASTDDAETSRRFAEANQADFPILADPEKTVARAYDVLMMGMFARRETFYIGPDGRILAVDKDVSPLSAGKDMVGNLTRLGVPLREATPP